MIEKALSVAINHLLASEPWARERLAPFAGERIELRAASVPTLRFVIAEDGLVKAAAADDAAASLAILVKAEAPAAQPRQKSAA